MERASQVMEIKRKAMRLVRECRLLDETRIFGALADQADLSLVGQPRKCRRPISALELFARKLLSSLAEHGMTTRRSVLHIEDRIVLRLLRNLGKVEIERRVALAVEHHEADRVPPHFLHHFTQRDEIPGTFRHTHWLAVPEQ